MGGPIDNQGGVTRQATLSMIPLVILSLWVGLIVLCCWSLTSIDSERASIVKFIEDESKRRLQTGQFNQSFAFLSEALRLSPGNETCLLLRSYTANSLGKYEAALDDTAKLIRDRSSSSLNGALRQRAEALRFLGRYAEAKEIWTRVIGLTPNDAVAWLRRAECNKKLGQRQEYERDLDKSNSLPAKDPVSLAKISIDMGSYDNAIAICDQALKAGDNENALLLKALALQRMGRFQEAIDTLKNCCKLKITRPPYFEIGLCQFVLGDYTSAVDNFQVYTSIAKDKSTPYAWLLRGLAHSRLNQESSARSAWTEGFRTTHSWPAPIFLVLLGRQSKQWLLNQSLSANQLTEASTYLALRDLRKDRANALRDLGWVAANANPNLFERDIATGVLKAENRQPGGAKKRQEVQP